MTTVPTFCFVIPCFNEEDNVGPTVDSVREAMGSRDDYEIVPSTTLAPIVPFERMRAAAQTVYKLNAQKAQGLALLQSTA